MFDQLPKKATEMFDWSWEKYQAFFENLAERPLNEVTVGAYLQDWSRLSERIDEVYSRLYVATTVDTSDSMAEERYNRFLDEIFPHVEAADQHLKQKMLDSGLEPDGFEIPLRDMKMDAEVYREVNLPLLTQEQKMEAEYNKIIGAQTVEWEGREITLQQLRPVFQETDRERREKAWRLASERQLQDRERINDLWRKLLDCRLGMAKNAGCADYREFRWKQLKRFDYSPEDCKKFHDAIEAEVVPAAARIYQKRQKQMGLSSLRPWDLEVDPKNRPPLKPFSQTEELIQGTGTIFERIHPHLGRYYQTMKEQHLLDLENRKNKAPGGYCTSFAAARRPFIFMNAVGIHDNVQTLLHESGHAFHVFEAADLPYYHQRESPIEFAEVASMSMELLAGVHLAEERGGFYSEEDADRARIEHLESVIKFWPYMAVVDAFQHWVYENPEEAKTPSACDEEWEQLSRKFLPAVDWSGLEEIRMTGWRRKLHIHTVPFYYVEYGLAQLGAVLVWKNSLLNFEKALADYRKALALGGTVPLPALYETAGARLAMDRKALSEAVLLVEETLEELE